MTANVRDSSSVHIAMPEWSHVGPEEHNQLAGYTFGNDVTARSLAHSLSQADMLVIDERVSGLSIQSRSFVGTVQIGPIRITVTPKIANLPLLRLVRYAYGLRDLTLHGDLSALTNTEGIQEILCFQVSLEAEEILRRGVHRSYVRSRSRLSAPRGRIEFRRLASEHPPHDAALACHHHPRIEDTVLNRLLLETILLASELTSNRDLRSKLRGLASRLMDTVSRTTLSGSYFGIANAQINRLSQEYTAVLRLAQLLFSGRGISSDAEWVDTVRVPGFLFDMNRLFQAVVGRFLSENLADYEVRQEYGLSGMMSYLPSFNPLERRSPTPRPDYAVLHRGTPVAILDAKYRDLWDRPLPRDMLYQLSIYALAHSDLGKSAIVYPSVSPDAVESRIQIRDALLGHQKGVVALRPLDLNALVGLLQNRQESARDRAALARTLCFGYEKPS